MLIERQVVKRLVWIVVINGVLNTIANMIGKHSASCVFLSKL